MRPVSIGIVTPIAALAVCFVSAADAPRRYPNSGGWLVWDRVRIAPAPGYKRDRGGGKFTGSNVSATEGFKVLAAIKTAPLAGAPARLQGRGPLVEDSGAAAARLPFSARTVSFRRGAFGR